MIKSAQNYPISSILDTEAKIRFVVPKYQREYVWKKTHWEDLFDDIHTNPAGHFLGSIICINRSDDVNQVQELELVDGQQRLTTLSLLYAAIFAQLGIQEGLDEETSHELYNLKYRLLLKGNSKALRVSPSYQNKNYQDYEAVLEKAGILKDVEQPANLGNRRILKAYRYFEEQLNQVNDKGKRLFSLPALRQLLEKVNAACLVKIEVNSHSDAFILFESLNNRGEPLSALDLIKNKLLAVLEKQQANSIDANFQKWNRLLENLTDDYAIQERYLRQFYNAFKFKDKIGIKGFTVATRSNIIQIYEKLIDKNAKAIFSDLFEKSQLYNRIIVPNDDSVPQKVAKQFRDLERIGGAPAYVLLLYLLAEQPNANLAGICEFLVKFFVRRSLTDQPPTRDLTRNAIALIDVLRHKPSGDALDVVQREFRKQGWIASDNLFREKLEGNVYDENVDATRFVLCKIEESHQTKEKFTDLWKRDSRGDYVWTVEHIFPQGANIPDNWVKMIAEGNEAKAREYREQNVHQLGNLTITGFNTEAKIAMQLGHAGAKGSTRVAWEGEDEPLPEGNWPLISASPQQYVDGVSDWSRAMTRADMDRVRDDFVRATRYAAEAGFDWMELHCAHGYLLSSFISPLTNLRTDAYGGPLANRLRYPLEVFGAMRDAWPKHLPMSVRISAHDWVEGGITPDDAIEIARAFEAAGADVIDCSAGQVSRKQKPVYGRMFQTPFADRVRNEAGIATIAVGAISEADHVNSIIGAGRADLCAIGRPQLANPSWTLMEAAKIGYVDLEWPKQYRTAKMQLVRNLERERAAAAAIPISGGEVG